MFFLELVGVHFLKFGWLLLLLLLVTIITLRLDFFIFCLCLLVLNRRAASRATLSCGFLLISQPFLLSCFLDHILKGHSVCFISVFLLLGDQRPLFSLLVEASTGKCLRIPPIVIENGPVVQVFELG